MINFIVNNHQIVCMSSDYAWNANHVCGQKLVNEAIYLSSLNCQKIVKCCIIYVYVYMVYPCNFIVICIHKEHCLELGYKYYKAQWWEMCELFGINEQQFYISDDNISRMWTWNCFSRIGNEFLLILPYFISLSVLLKDTSVVASGMEQNPWPAQG